MGFIFLLLLNKSLGVERDLKERERYDEKGKRWCDSNG
jgi:hypothetical protein